MDYVVTCPKGLEGLLTKEVGSLGAAAARETRAAVTFSGPLDVAYRVCLWSRLASRVLFPVGEFSAATAAELYQGAAAVPWEEHVAPDGTLAVSAVGTTQGLVHSGFAAQTVKDAVVDRLRRVSGERPTVSTERPHIRLNLRLHRERATLSLDLSGEPLHRRGYRTPGEPGEAPLKETLAAAILIRAGWPEIGAARGALLDPMCGTGTLLVEGALMAADQAPGLLRDYWGFRGWLGHDPRLWEELLAEADGRAETGRAGLPLMAGWDADSAAVDAARTCLRRAGFADRIPVAVRDLSRFAPPKDQHSGLVVTNPPHGLRLGSGQNLRPLYAMLGRRLLQGFVGWRAAVFTPDAELAWATGLRAHKVYTLYNGPTETGLYLFEVTPERALRGHAATGTRRTSGEVDSRPHGSARPAADRGSSRPPGPPGDSRPAQPGSEALAAAEMFANRLRKNLRHLGRWARREAVTCFRVYDADLPEYAVAVDLYQGKGPDEGRMLAHVQEYAPPATVDPARASERLAAALAVLPDVLDVASEDVAVKVRRRQRGAVQYGRQGEVGTFIEVAEGGLRFLVNLTDYVDTGLFLDHRLTRARLRALSEGRRFLNVFAYTGTAGVYAAAGGARSITTVDLSPTYLDWARRNFELNGYAVGPRNRLVRADVLAWLEEERERVASGAAEPYDLIFLDPPTFSNSTRMGDRTFAVQRDHGELIAEAAALLSAEGVLVFSTNHRRFRLDRDALPDLSAADITRETIPPDFGRNPRVHSCFIIRSRP